MTTSASASSRSNSEPGPSLSEVTTSVCPSPSSQSRRPSAPVTLPSSSPGVKSTAFGVGRVWPSGIALQLRADRRACRWSDSRPPGRRRGRTESSPFFPPSRWAPLFYTRRPRSTAGRCGLPGRMRLTRKGPRSAAASQPPWTRREQCRANPRRSKSCSTRPISLTRWRATASSSFSTMSRWPSRSRSCAIRNAWSIRISSSSGSSGGPRPRSSAVAGRLCPGMPWGRTTRGSSARRWPASRNMSASSRSSTVPARSASMPGRT